MKILILGNMANDGYSVAKEMRKMHVDADLAINISDFGMALPEWEDGDFQKKVDPYEMEKKDIENSWRAPNWIIYFDFLNKLPRKKYLIKKIKSRVDIIKMIRKYDIIETHVPWAMYAQFSGRPYVVYDAGWIRYFPFGASFRDKLARRGYKKAKKIILTNPDTYKIFDELPYLKKEKIFFVPFAIDPEKYKPSINDNLRNSYVSKDEILFFCPSRQIWKEKGNDKLIRSYAKFVNKFTKSKLIMVSWSIDDNRSKDLVKKLDIQDKVIWIEPVPKNKLIEYYNTADIVLDQFILGSWGTSTPEAMACAKPVLMYYKKEYIIRAFGEEPPILNSFSEEEIYQNMMKLATDKKFREDIGAKSREWIIKTHSPSIVAQKHLEILRDSS
jgi:glycosyltransferase involved in cell wall biosynthesis